MLAAIRRRAWRTYGGMKNGIAIADQPKAQTKRGRMHRAWGP